MISKEKIILKLQLLKVDEDNIKKNIGDELKLKDLDYHAIARIKNLCDKYFEVNFQKEICLKFLTE